MRSPLSGCPLQMLNLPIRCGWGTFQKTIPRERGCCFSLDWGPIGVRIVNHFHFWAYFEYLILNAVFNQKEVGPAGNTVLTAGWRPRTWIDVEFPRSFQRGDRGCNGKRPPLRSYSSSSAAISARKNKGFTMSSLVSHTRKDPVFHQECTSPNHEVLGSAVLNEVGRG